MNGKDIKPIPKNIEKKIYALDDERVPEQRGLRFYAYLTTIKKELVKITVAVRNKSKKQRLMKQVAVHGVYSDKCLVRDLEYCYLSIYAYRVGWYYEGIKYCYGLRPFYNDGIWYSVPYKYYNPYAPLVDNRLALKLFPYAALHVYNPICIISYLRTYLKYPQTEYLIKLGLSKFVSSKMILEKIGKDKKFCKWLIANKEALKNNPYYISVILRSYRTGKPLDCLQAFAEAKKIFGRGEFGTLKRAFRDDLNRLLDYVSVQKIGVTTYNDYYKACVHLGLDMTEEKNRFPHNFMRWHDIRIDEYATAKAVQDAEKRKELYGQFAAITEKYLPLQYKRKSAFIVVIAQSPADLIREGELLHHCVGRMNYDQKFIREETLIFFIRNVAEPDVPFVTVEYSPSRNMILQCYGERDTRPNQTVLDFVNNQWLPYANRQMKQIAA